MKIAINVSYGGFRLSNECIMRYFELQNKPVWFQNDYVFLVPPCEHIYNKRYNDNIQNIDTSFEKKWREQSFFPKEIDRSDPFLIKAIQELGLKASGWGSYIKIVDIPDDVDWMICESEGKEWVAEKHRIWK